MGPALVSRPSSAQTYRPPELLQDIRLLDLLELTGSSLRAAALLNLSQSTVSRRSRFIATELALELRSATGSGALRFGDGPCLRLLRRAAKRHRLDAGVGRIASDGWLAGSLQNVPQVLAVPTCFRPLAQWQQLVRGHVLDGALVSGQELRQQIPDLPTAAMGPNAWPWQGCMLVPLNTTPLRLVRRQVANGHSRSRQRWGTVLMPSLQSHGALAALVRQQQLYPKHLANGNQSPQGWANDLRATADLALVTSHWGQQLQACGVDLETMVLPQPLELERWLLVHRRDWHKHSALEAMTSSLCNALNTESQEI